MWKAAFTGRSEGGGSSAGRPSEPRRKKSHRAESVISTRARDDDDRRRSTRHGSVFDDGAESVYGVPTSGGIIGYGSPQNHMANAAPLTASALRMLPDDEEEWEDEDRDARSERKSRRSEGGEKRRKSGGKEREREKGKERERERVKGSKDRSRSDSRERERKKSTGKSAGKEREKEKDRTRDSHRNREIQSERERDAKRRPQLVQSREEQLSRALPSMGSFEQFPGQYASGHMGLLPTHQQDAIMSGALPNSAPQQGQFPGQDPYHDQGDGNNRPSLEHSNHSWGAAADYYLDAGESVQHQPGVRINSPNMLVNPDQHLIAASAQPIPAVDTGNGAAIDFYSGKTSPVHGVSASAPVTPASKPKPKPAKQSSWSAFKPSKTSKPGKMNKPSKPSSSSTAAAALATAAGVGVLSGASHTHSSSFQQQTSSSTPNHHSSGGSVYYGPPPQSQSQPPVGGFASSSSPSYTYGVPGSTTAQGSVNAYGAQSTNGGTNYTNDYATAHSIPGKQSANSNSNAPIYAAAGAAAAGLAAYGVGQYHQQSHNMASSSSYGNGGQGPPGPPRPGLSGFSHYPSSGGGGTGMHQMHHRHEHKGPMTRLKDGLFNLISTPEDTAKMEMYTEYIGVCKHCFDPRTSPWDAPRQHHYHKGNRRDSFDELRRRRSSERLGRKGSNDSLRRAGGVRIDKDSRYYASDSSRKRRESGKATGILGAGLAAAGVATAANAIFGDGRKDFDDTYSVKSGHRERSAARRRSRSSSREQRRKSTHGILKSTHQENFVTVRRKDGAMERRRVRKQSRSSSREGRSNSFFGAAAGAALGAGAASAGMRHRSRSRSRDSKGRRSERQSLKSSYGRGDEPSSGGIFGFFSPPQQRRTSRKEHHKKRKGFFAFSNSSSSSSNSELAFGEGFSSKTSLPLRRKSSGRSTTRKTRRSSDDHLAATVAGIGATAAALVAAQRGGRINKRSGKVELGARKDLYKRGRAHTHGFPGTSDDEWEDELPSDVDSDSSLDGGLAFGDYGDRRISSRQSLESINSQSSAGGLGAWGWRWGGKDKKKRPRNSTSPRHSYAPNVPDAFPQSVNSRPYASGQASYLDDTGRRLPSMTSTSSPSVPTRPLQVVDPQPISDSGVSGSRHNSMPGAFGPDSPPIYRPGPAPLQQPQPTTPIKPAFTQNTSALEDSNNWSRSSPRTSSSNNFAQNAALIGGALATAGIIAATSSNNSSGKKARDLAGSNVRFGLTEDQQRKENRERRKEEKQADEDRRRADRTRALKEEAERATRESELRRADAEAREARQEEVRRVREDENRKVAEEKLAAARREAEEQAQIDAARQVEQQRSLREREETYRREQARLVEEARQQEEQREADERERFIRQQQEVERRGKERKNAERKTSKSGRSRGQSVSEQNEKNQSTAWEPVAGAAAAATVGAVIAGRESRDRKERDEAQSVSRRLDQQYQAKEVVPQTSHDGEPLMDDEIYDPDFFKRKHTPAQRVRHEELARKAADKVISDREHAYDDHSTYAEFFAPKDVLSEPAEGKTKVLGPNADNDIQVYHARDETILSHLDGARYGGSYGQSKHAPFGVPKLNLISPTPPIADQNPVGRKNSTSSSPSSPLVRAAETVENVPASAETDSDGKSERLNRSISWGQDKTHIYEVRTPESYNEKERDSYISSSDVGAASPSSAEQLREIVVEEALSNDKSKTTTYNEDELAKHYRISAQRGSSNGVAQKSLDYRQPYADSVSDFSVQLPPPGTKGRPATREYGQGNTDEPTPAEEKRQTRIPGGFDDDTDEIRAHQKTSASDNHKEDEPTSAGPSREIQTTDESAWEPPLSKKDKKKREKAAKAAEQDLEPQPPFEEPAAWEPPLTKKEQKKRDKAAKRSSTIDSEPQTPSSADPESAMGREADAEVSFADASFEEPTWEAPLSKKEQKKRDKAKKQGFADLVSSLDNSPREMRDSDSLETRDLETSTGADEEPHLTKKEQRKQDKQAKKSGLGDFADVADTILAAGGVAAAAAALDSTEDDGFSPAGKKKGKKGKKARLGEPLNRDIRDAEPESPKTEQSSMPGGWDVDQESPPQKEDKSTAFDPFQYQIHDNDSSAPPTAPEPPAAQEVDPWAEFSEPKKSKKKSKRNSSAFNVPEVSSPLRTEVAWDDYVTVGKSSTDDRENGKAPHTNGHDKSQDGVITRSDRTPGEPTPTASERRGSDYFGDSRQEGSGSSPRTSPDDLRSVASAPTPSRREDGRRGSDYFDEPSYAYETQSISASEPADAYGSSKKSKRRSRHEDDEPRRSRIDDDDDTRSVTSSRSRRDKEESPSVKKDKKGGILGSLFGRKSESSRDVTRESKSSKDDEDEDARRRRKKKHRESDIGDDDGARSVMSESRHRSHRSHSEHGDDDETRSMRSDSRRKSSRSEPGTEDSRERRRRSVQDSDHDRDVSESGKKHHERRKSGEDSRSSSRHESRSESGHRHHRRRKTDEDTKDQSFLGRRVEDQPPLPADVLLVSSPAAIAESEQGDGTPAQAGLDVGTVNTNDDENQLSMRTLEEVSASATTSTSAETLSPRPGSAHRAASSTAVPLRFPFGHAPLTPPVGHTKDRSMSFSSPVAPLTASSPTSPVAARKSRQDRPRSTEIKPLYLVERNRKTPEVEDALPSLPSSGPSSRASSVQLSDAYESAVEDMESPLSDRKKLQLDTGGAEKWRDENSDVLGSKETTPKASDAPQFQPFFHSSGEPHVKQEPQFYTWEDFAREERGREVDDGDLPPLPRSRSESPLKPEDHVGRDGVKVAAAAALIGTAAVYAAGALSKPSSEDSPTPAWSRERELKNADMPGSAPDTKAEIDLKPVAAPLVRKSSMKNKGNKAKKLQWQDEEIARATSKTPTLEAVEHAAPEAAAQQPQSNTVYASAAAHTTRVINYGVDQQERSQPLGGSAYDDPQDDKEGERSIDLKGVQGLERPNEDSAPEPISADRAIEDSDRPSGSYKIPTAKAAPALLVVEERTAAAATDDSPSATEGIQHAPQLTRKQSEESDKSKKSKKKRQSVSLFEHGRGSPTLGESGNIAAVDEDPAEARGAELLTSDAPVDAAEPLQDQPRAVEATLSQRDFSVADFSNLSQGSAMGWHDSQAEAFRSAMLGKLTNVQRGFDTEASGDADIQKMPDIADANVPSAISTTQLDEPDETTSMSFNGKKVKKDKKAKKQKASRWSETELAPEPAPIVPPVTADDSPLARKVDDEQLSSVEEENVVASPFSKKTKKDKTKKKDLSAAWDESETTGESVRLSKQAEPLEAADSREPPHEDDLPGTPVAESQTLLESSSKKSKKDKKKKKVSAWDEPEMTEDATISNQVTAVAEASLPTGDQESTPAVDEPIASASSKRKSKKDKKRQFLAWDEPEAPEETALSSEQRNVDVENDEPFPSASTPKASLGDDRLVADLDSSLSLAVDHSTNPTAVDDSFAAMPKKSKKSKKNKQSLAFSDTLAEPTPVMATLENDDEAAFLDAEEEQRQPGSQSMRGEEHTVTKGVLVGSAVVSATTGLINSQESVTEPAANDFGPIMSKKSKKKKKQSTTFDQPEDKADVEPQDEFVDAEESLVVGETRHDDTEPVHDAAARSPNTGEVTNVEVTASREINDDVQYENIPTATLSQKQSKKDKKKKRHLQVWEPEPQPELEPTTPPRPGEEQAEAATAEIAPTEPTQELSASTDLVSEAVPARSLTRKQSKKDKKRNLENSSSAAEQDPQPHEDPKARSADVEAVAGSAKSYADMPIHSEGAPQDIPLPSEADDEFSEYYDGQNPVAANKPEDIPLPLETDDEFHGSCAAVGMSQDTVARSPSFLDTQQVDPNDIKAASAPSDDSVNVGTQLADCSFSGDSSVPEADDFFGPADPLMEEPSRMTEDLDAFGELNPRALEKEKRRAEREAAESARLAESMQEQPKDENYASLLTARKPITKKGSKKGRKSISSATPPASCAPDQNSAVESRENPRDIEEIAKQDMSPLYINQDDAAGPVPFDEPRNGSQDDDIWGQSSKKKGKKGKTGRVSISETPMVVTESSLAVEDTVPADLSTGGEQISTTDADATQNTDSNIQPSDAQEDEEVWGSSSKKGKTSKKSKKSIPETEGLSKESFVKLDVGEDSITLDEEGVEPRPSSDDVATRDSEPTPTETQVEAQPAQSEDVGWASTPKKKGKKGKKSISMAKSALEPQVSIGPDLTPANASVLETEPAHEPILPVVESSAPVAEPVEEDIWTSTSKKKNKKNKRAVSIDDAASVPERLPGVVSAQLHLDAGEEDKDVVADSAPTVVDSSAVDIGQTEADPNDEFQDFSWSSNSKKKGKKGKKDRSSTVQVAPTEVNGPAQDVPPEAVTPATQHSAEVLVATDAEQSHDMVSENNIGIGAETAWELPSTKKKGKKGKKSLSEAARPVAESPPLEIGATEMSRPASPRNDAEGLKASCKSQEADADPVEVAGAKETIVKDDAAWELPSSNKKKKSKKGMKSEVALHATDNRNSSPLGEFPAEPEADPPQTSTTADEADELPAGAKSSSDHMTGMDLAHSSVGSKSAHDEQPGKEVDGNLDPAEDAIDSSRGLPAHGKKAKKGKKSQQSWEDEESLQGTDQAGPTEAAEATRPDQPLFSHDEPAESARAEATSESIDDDHSHSLGIGAATAAAAVAGAIASEVHAPEQEQEWDSFPIKKSKKDKKKSKQNGLSDAPSTPSDKTPDKGDIPSDFVQHLPDTTAPELTPEETRARTEPIEEDEWASFSSKKSKKEKKKSKQSSTSTPIPNRDNDTADYTSASVPPANNADELSWPGAKEESIAAAITEPAEDDWSNFSTRTSKKDKKKAKQSGTSTPIALPEDNTVAQVTGGLVPDKSDVASWPETKAESTAGAADPVEDDWASFSTKKSKKDKKKSKKSGASTSPATVGDGAAVTVEAALESTAAAKEVQNLSSEPPESIDREPEDSAPVSQTVEPEVDAWDDFSSTKQSKKDKKKAKKSGLAASKAGPDEHSSDNAREIDENMASKKPPPVESSAALDPDLHVSQPEDDKLATTARQVDIDRDQTAMSRSLNVPSAPTEPVQPGGTQALVALPTTPSPAQDIDFAATLAAGLADSGFDPDMVINDPVFHRRASPPGNVPEADPEELSFPTSSKRKKGRKSKSGDDGDARPEDPMSLGPIVPDGQLPLDDFNDTISQSLRGTGFDPALLEEALASNEKAQTDDRKDDDPDFSFVTTKSKKGKKDKTASVSAEEVAPNAITTETTPLSGKDTEIDKPEAAVNGRDVPAEDTSKPEEANAPLSDEHDSNRDFVDPAAHLAIGEGEMDVDEMDKAYKAYKKNKRKQRKTKALTKPEGSSDNPESSMDTEKSAAASDSEARTLRNPSTAEGVEKSGPQGYLHTSEVSQLLPVAVGVVGLAAGSPDTGGSHDTPTQSARTLASNEPEWSFAPLLEDSKRGVPKSDHGDKEHQVIRDSCYEEANRSLQRSERSIREIPKIARPSSSRESLRNRRSLEPLNISTGSTPDEEFPARTAQGRTEPSTTKAPDAQTSTPIADTPLLPTSKNRTSYLFQSPPDNLAASAGSSSQNQLYDPQTPRQRSEDPDFSKSRENSDDRAGKTNQRSCSTAGSEAFHDRPSFSPMGAGPLSPRTPLRSIAEESHPGKRSKASSDAGVPQQIKLSKRGQPPQDLQSTRTRHRTLSPEITVPPGVPMRGSSRAVSNPLSTDDIIKRLSWPSVDEENDTVNIDRSVSRKAIMPDMRSSSVLSNRSTTSGTYGRSAQEVRSYSRNSNQSNQSHSSTPSLRRINLSGDLRAASRRGETGSSVSGSAPNTIPFEAPPTPPLNDDELNSISASRAVDMSDVFVSLNDGIDNNCSPANDAQQGYGDAAESHVSPTRPPSVRKRQSMHINELESRLDSLVAENRALQEARQSQDSSRYVVNDQNLVETLQQRELDLQAKDVEINQIKAMLQPMQEEIARLTEMNSGLTEANRNLVDDTNGRYATLQAEHAQAHEQWQLTTRNLESMQQEHGRITSGMKDILEAEIAAALSDKNAEILRLREQLDIATEQIRALQVQIQSSNSSDFLIQRDEDYFDGSCQKLCQHVQQWVLRFSKLSDNRVCRLSTELNDDKLEARLDNAVLDGSDVDKLLGDRIRRRDVFMSVVMTMVWEYIFTRYLFGMDREQRQKLKALEKLLCDVGPPRAVAHWRATTLTLLSKRPNFRSQCAMDTEAVAIEIFGVLCSLLPPPSASEQQLLTSLQKVIGIAVDLSIEMRTQRAEYIMLPPLQPEYDTNGDLVRKVHFNASLMNERSGFFSSNEELAAEHAVVKIVLFPLVVKKGDDVGEGEEEIVVCPAQVLVRNDAGKGKKVVRVMSGAMEIDDPIRSRSQLSSKPSIMSEGGAF